MKLTGTILRNPDTGYFLAFLNEYSGVIAQGASEEEAKEKLGIAFRNYLKFAEKRADKIEFSEPNTM